MSCPLVDALLSPPAIAQPTKYDYVIIIASNDLVNAVDTLKTWKEQLGFSVKVVDVPQILSLYPTGDRPSRIWDYLHDRYDGNNWGIQYVLLVGDIDEIPIRILYPDGNPGDGLRFWSDFYYANLNQANWDVDNDNRWGEFTQDQLDTIPEVSVGRIPFNNANDVQSICENIVAFEQDTGGWKHKALLAHGVMDYAGGFNSKADQGVLGEKLDADFFTPHGWSTYKLDEAGGISPSTFPRDTALTSANYEAQCAPHQYGFVSAAAHGNPNGISSFQWVADLNNNNRWDTDKNANENVGNWFLNLNAIATHPATSIVYLNGCTTALIVEEDSTFDASPLRSLFIDTDPKYTITNAYLKYGAPAVIGCTVGMDYSKGGWAGPQDGDGNAMEYYFVQRLVDQNRRAGDAFDLAHLDYARKHGLQRGMRNYNFFGDPSLVFGGVSVRPGGPDRVIHEGFYQDWGADNDDNGDMYVAVTTTQSSQAPGAISVYKSIDHGETWYLWTTIVTPDEVWSVDALVGRFQSGETLDSRVHVFYTSPTGDVTDVAVAVGDSTQHRSVLVDAQGNSAVRLQCARDPQPMPAANTLYVTWDYSDGGILNVVIATSEDNGATWTPRETIPDRQMPDVDVLTNGFVYLAMAASGLDEDPEIYLLRSFDYGVTWAPEISLTTSDGAVTHTYPSVACSTDPSYPVVWIAYDYHDADGDIDLRYTYSDDYITWNGNRVISADPGIKEQACDMRSYRAAPNRWINISYNQDFQPNPNDRRNIVWRYSNGSIPKAWSSQRIVNDNEPVKPGPWWHRLVYSPGAPGTGSGVTYGGVNQTNLYFSAPWLSGPAPAPQLAATRAQDAAPAAMVASAGVAGVATATRHDRARSPHDLVTHGDDVFLVWAEAGEADGATSINFVDEAAGGDLWAAGTASAPAGNNEGAVFHSVDDGDHWLRMGTPTGATSLGCVLETPGGNLLVGGATGSDGAIFMSSDNGDNWTNVQTIGDGAVNAIIADDAGDLFAATGRNGGIFRSEDDGNSWTEIAALGTGVEVRDIEQSGDGTYLVALNDVAPSPVMTSPDGMSWSPAAGLGALDIAYDLLDAGEVVYVSGAGGGAGMVYRALPDGASWSPTPAIPGGTVAIRSLALDPDGALYAGAQVPYEQSHTNVYMLVNDYVGWVAYGGGIDLANAVRSMVVLPQRFVIGTGHVYGNIYRSAFGLVVGVGDGDVPRDVVVMPAYPNPFNPSTKIAYVLPRAARVTVDVFDVSGRRIGVLKSRELEVAGRHEVVWDGHDDAGHAAASGVYFYRVRAGDVTQTGKMVLVK